MTAAWEAEFASLLELRDSGTGPRPGAVPLSPHLSGVLAAEDAVTRLLEGSTPTSLPRRTGPFTLLTELGRGGMGVVYHAYDEMLGRHVALKMLSPSLADSAEFRARFLREAAIAAQVEHPHLLRVYGEGELEGTLYFTMELVPGAASVATLIAALAPLADQPLRDEALRVLDRFHIPLASSDPGAVPLGPTEVFGRRVAALFAEAAEGLAALHARGVIHRDIKPSNLLFHPERGICLADFGLARWEGSTLTATTAHLGSPGYMSPEQARGGGEETTPASDIYSLGLTALEVLDGHPAIEAPNLEGLLLAALNGTHRAPSAKRRGMPEALDRILSRCLALRPDDRYASAEALRADLELVARGKIVSTQPVSRLRLWTRRVARRWPWIATLLVLVGFGSYKLLNPPPSIYIDSFPDAEVLLDGEAVGRTPLWIRSATPGRRHISIQQPGFVPKEVEEVVATGEKYAIRRPTLVAEPGSLIAFKHWMKALTTKEPSLALVPTRGANPSGFIALLPRGPLDAPPHDLIFLVEGDVKPEGSFYLRRLGEDQDLWQAPVIGKDSLERVVLPESARRQLSPGKYEWGLRSPSGVAARAEFTVLGPEGARGLLGAAHEQVNRMDPSDPLRGAVEAQLLVNEGLYDRAFRSLGAWPYDVVGASTTPPSLHVLVAALDGLGLAESVLRSRYADLLREQEK